MEGDVLMSMDINADIAMVIATSKLYSTELYDSCDVCTVSTKNELVIDALREIPYVYRIKQTPKITYVVCKQCGAPVMIKSPCCPWCKVPYEWAHELEVV